MTYRKWGRTIRYENGTIVRVDEAGEAVEIDGEFEAHPIRERRALPELRVPRCALRGERVVLVEGVAVHETNGVTWTEHARRMHLALVKPPFRMLIDQADFDVDRSLLDLFERLDVRREPPPRMALAPRVSAAILHSLAAVSLAQRAGEHPDGKGTAIETRAVEGEPPNWYRPSYRVRPLRAWFNLMALPFGKLDHAAPRAVALLDHGDVLCVDRDDVFAAPLRAGRVLAVGGAAEWFPFGAGAWGADMLLESAP